MRVNSVSSAGEDLADDRGSRQCATRQLLPVLLDRLDHRIAGLPDLILAEVERAVREPPLDLCDARLELFGEAGETFDELLDDERHDPGDDADRTDEDDEDGGRPRHPLALQPVDEGTSSADARSARPTGIRTVSSLVTMYPRVSRPAKMTSSRHVHSAATRTTGCTDAEG